MHDDVPHQINTEQAKSARVYDHVLGGKDYYAADERAAAAMLKAWPPLATSMPVNRDTMRRMARWLSDQGVSQFLDIGTGIPNSPNLHEVVQQNAPRSRVVYVDNDPSVLLRARALLTSTPEGRTEYIDADMHDPHLLLNSPVLRETFDLTQPVAVTIIAMLQYVEDASGLVRKLTAALAPGSYVALTTATADTAPEQVTEMARVFAEHGTRMHLCTHAEVEAMLTDAGLEILDPGVVLMHRWRPEGDGADIPDEHVNMYAAVARLPEV